MTAMNKTIIKRKLSDEVMDRLLIMIRSGQLMPGAPLPSERQFMEEYGVGRPAIREAMQALQRMGLIEIRHGERARVCKPSLGNMIGQLSETMRHVLTNSSATLEHLKEVRATFEMEMARTAAKRNSADDISRLESVLRAQREAIGDGGRFLELDGSFHREIAAIGGNPIWVAVSEAMFSWLAHFHVSLVSVPGREDLTLTEHEQILTTIKDRDADGAAKAMADHLSRANRLYRQVAAGK